MNHLFLLLFLPVVLSGLSFASFAQPGNTTTIKNGIKLNTDGLKVTKAYLSDEEGNPLKKNETTLNNPVYIRFEVTGWAANNEKVKPGASEKITTDNGTLVLYEDDLFPGKEEYSPEDAKYISLKAVITKTWGNIKFFMVKFRVWDKNNGNNFTGSYTFTIKN